MKKIDIIINAKHTYTLQGEGVGYLENNSIAVFPERSQIEIY